jgi:hypothetical protein
VIAARELQRGELGSTSDMVTYPVPHTTEVLEQLLARAKDLVADGEARLVAQEARLADLARKGGDSPESWKLLKIMRDTQNLQVGHLKLLERELGPAG